MVDFDLNHFGATDFDLIYKSFFRVSYDFDLNKKNSMISYNSDNNIVLCKMMPSRPTKKHSRCHTNYSRIRLLYTKYKILGENKKRLRMHINLDVASLDLYCLFLTL